MLAALALIAAITGTGLAVNDAVSYANTQPTPVIQTVSEAECYDIDGDGWVNYDCECVTATQIEAFPEE